ncbi:MAG: sulfite exporter TauE/SafE family protein [Flavobacteriales bacterium]|nr:sulfite exporter TauE/SafE family protein [Flavobacteriales bacterium]
MFQILILVATGLAAGYLSGLLGLGGGVIVIPALIYLLGYSQHLAQGTTLGLMVLPIGLAAALEYHKKGFLDVRAALIMAVVFVIGSYMGSKMALQVDAVTLRKGFAVLLVAIALKMFFQTR